MDSIFVAQRRAAAALAMSRLVFKPLRLADIPLVNKCLQRSQSRACDFTIGGLYMWADYFKYEYCVVDDTLFVKGVDEANPAAVAFMVPVGSLSLGAALHLLRDYCRRRGFALAFTAVPDYCVADLRDALGRSARVEELPGWADYVYDIDSLATLAGKSLMRKRNHVNRFLADNPHWLFEALTADLLPETMLFFEGLCRRDAAAASALEAYENGRCRRVLANLSSYPFEGAVLRGESGEIVAFALGEVVADTLFVHVEKINHEVSGAGAAINKLFAAFMRRRHPSLRFVNREEDCGDPGLRQAKESYCPLLKLRKYDVR